MPLGLRLCALHLAVCLALGSIPAAIPPPEQLFAEEPKIHTPLPQISGMDDVSPTDWFYTYVRLGYRHGFLQGRRGNFEPNRAITQAEFIAILGRFHRALGGYVEYDASAIEPGAGFHMPYLLWATNLDIITEDEAERFRPNDPVLRAEIATMLINYIDVYSLYDYFLPQYEHHSENYTDFAEIPSRARVAARLLRSFGIMQGIRRSADPPGIYRFEPFAHTLRRDTAVIFARMFVTIFDGTVAI